MKRRRFTGFGARRRVGVALASCVQLGLELLVIKLLHYEFGALSLGAIGLSLLGVALGAPLTRWLGGIERGTDRAFLLLAPALLVAGAALFSLEHRVTPEASMFARLFVVGAACLVALALSTVPIYIEVARTPGNAFGAYAASLIGGAFGVPATLGLVHAYGDATAFAAVMALVAPAALLLGTRPGAGPAGAGLAIGAAALATVWLPRLDASAHAGVEYSASNALSRVDVERGDGQTLSFRTAGVNAGTTTAFPAGTEDRKRLLTLASALPFRTGAKRSLILGSGAGKNVVQALDLGAEAVVTVEINAMILDYLQRALPARDDPYRDSRVTPIVGEGRAISARLKRGIDAGAPAFDLVFVPVATLFGSSGHALTETYLMTREAFGLYLGMLTPDGKVAVYFPLAAETKIVAALAAALGDHGASPPAAHLAVVEARDNFVALARPSRPFAATELEQLARQVEGGRSVDAAPLVERGSQQIGLSDDNPFLYNDVERLFGKRKHYGLVPSFLRTLLGASFVLLGAGIVRFALRPGPRPTMALGFAAAFAAMGVAFTVVQTGLIQRLAFLLGHPALAAAVVLPGTLLGSGIGSWLSGRIPERRFAALRLSTTGLLVVCILGIAVARPQALLMPDVSLAAKVMLGLLCAIVPFLVMGSFFPVIFSRLELDLPELTAWAWLINGVAAVVGTLFVIHGSMRFGFRVTLSAAALVYAALGVWDALAKARRFATVADIGLCTTLVITLLAGA